MSDDRKIAALYVKIHRYKQIEFSTLSVHIRIMMEKLICLKVELICS